MGCGRNTKNSDQDAEKTIRERHDAEEAAQARQDVEEETA